MEESSKAQESKMDERRRNRPLLIAIAALGILLYTGAVCAVTVAVDRKILADRGEGAFTGWEDPYAAAGRPGAGPADPMALQFGEKITMQDLCEFTVMDCEFGSRIVAPNAMEESPGYEANSDAEGYVNLTVRYRNLSRTAANIDAIASPVLTCPDGDQYGAFAVIEDAGGRQFIEYAEVSPSRSAQLHYLFLVPKDVGEGAFWIEFTLADEAFAIGFDAGFPE